MWVEQEWTDYKLRWDPEEYGGVQKLHVPADQIWLPDLVLYNNADGNYEVTIMTKATIHHDGRVVWKPPSIYKSACAIDVEYFPFDEQTCTMKFGTWTYDGTVVDLKHKSQVGQVSDAALIEQGMDLSEFYLSVEWDVMSVPAVRTEKYYSCCDTPYIDITFNITLRRKTLYYTVNLILPTVIISGLSIVVFYLPPDSGEKISLSISIVLSLGVFFLLLSEIIPPTSLAIPLLGRYLIFTLVLVNFSVGVTILVINVNFRSPSTHKMSPWVRHTFLEVLPKLLGMQRPHKDSDNDSVKSQNCRKSSFVSEKGPLVVTTAPEARRFSGGSLTSDENGFCAPSTAETAKRLQGKTMQVVTSMPYRNGPSVIGPLRGRLEQQTSLPSYKSAVATSSQTNDIPQASSCLHDQRKAEMEHALLSVRFVAQHTENLDNFSEIHDDWKYLALVLDRLFLWIFMAACVAGTVGIVLRAPTLYDDSEPIDIILSKVGRRMRNLPPIDI
jgi:nicotinic acetylcholine receptor